MSASSFQIRLSPCNCYKPPGVQGQWFATWELASRVTSQPLWPRLGCLPLTGETSKCNRVPWYFGLSLTLILHSDKTLMFSCKGGYRSGWQSSGSVVQRTSAFFVQPKMGLGTRLENITLPIYAMLLCSNIVVIVLLF